MESTSLQLYPFFIVLSSIFEDSSQEPTKSSLSLLWWKRSWLWYWGWKDGMGEMVDSYWWRTKTRDFLYDLLLAVTLSRLCEVRPVTWSNWSLADECCGHLHFLYFLKCDIVKKLCYCSYFLYDSLLLRGHHQLWMRQPVPYIREKLRTFPAHQNPEEVSQTQSLHAWPCSPGTAQLQRAIFTKAMIWWCPCSSAL